MSEPNPGTPLTTQYADPGLLETPMEFVKRNLVDGGSDPEKSFLNVRNRSNPVKNVMNSVVLPTGQTRGEGEQSQFVPMQDVASPKKTAAKADRPTVTKSNPETGPM